MKYQFHRLLASGRDLCQPFLSAAVLAGALLLASHASAQITNAYDEAIDPAYTAYLNVTPNGLSPGGQNGGFGFGPWTFTVNGNGGAFLQGNSGPSGASFDLWNTAANSTTTAVRPFNSPLAVGDSFSVATRLNSLDFSYTTNALVLQDAGGNTVFSYWHVGFEPNGATNGSYADASTTSGVAVGFTYNYQNFSTFTFTLNSATTYTFTDNTTGHSFTGTISGAPITQVAFIRGNGNPNGPGNGQDFQFDRLKIVASAPPIFQQQTPAANAFSASTTNTISVQVIPGGSPINTGSIAMALDGGQVSPTVTTSSGSTTISYHPAAPLSSGANHTVRVTLADNNNNLFTNSWSFTTGFPSLPAVLAGPISASNSTDVVIATAAGDGWLGTNYQSSSSKTLYARFSAEYDITNATGLSWGGFQFFQDNTERLLVGKSGISPNWSVAGNVPDTDIPPVTTITTNEWHTFVVRVDYATGGNASAKIWLDPDFSQTEASQLNAPLTLTLNNTFNNLRVRCGFAPAMTTYSNIVLAATSAGVGFAAPSDPQFQSYIPGANATSAQPATPVGVTVLFGTYAINANTVVMTLDGANVTPTFTTGATSLTMNYQPPTPFTPGSTHSVTVNLTDSNGQPHSTSWSFTVDSYPALPLSLAGPYDVSGGVDTILWTADNGWINGNYDSNSTNVLYTKFSMVFYDLNGETTDGQGGCYGGLHFFQDNNERLLVGETWQRIAWSCDTKKGGATGETNLLPITTITVGDWHTMVVKNQFVAGGDTIVKVWLDPDFSKPEDGQLYPPLLVSMNNTFNNIRLRCGNGSAFAEFTNIVMTATTPFTVAPAPAQLFLQSVSGGQQLSWTGTGTLEEAPAITGPWTDAASQVNPQIIPTTETARFFRLRQ